MVAASWLGKLKTAVQVAAIIALIAFDPATAWVDALVYAALSRSRLISGADYFFGVRRRIEDQRRGDGAAVKPAG